MAPRRSKEPGPLLDSIGILLFTDGSGDLLPDPGSSRDLRGTGRDLCSGHARLSRRLAGQAGSGSRMIFSSTPIQEASSGVLLTMYLQYAKEGNFEKLAAIRVEFKRRDDLLASFRQMRADA